MPNWCENHITISHPDSTKIDLIIEHVESGILQALIPCPLDLVNCSEESDTDALMEKYDVDNMQDWCVENWGVKWDLNILDEDDVYKTDDNTVVIYCNTAWNAPLTAYGKLLELGYNVVAYYHEPGCQIAGMYINGDLHAYESWGNATGAKNMLPSQLDEMFSISDMLDDEDED